MRLDDHLFAGEPVIDYDVIWSILRSMSVLLGVEYIPMFDVGLWHSYS